MDRRPGRVGVELLARPFPGDGQDAPGPALAAVGDPRHDVVPAAKHAGVADPHASTSGEIDAWIGGVAPDTAGVAPRPPSSAASGPRQEAAAPSAAAHASSPSPSPPSPSSSSSPPPGSSTPDPRPPPPGLAARSPGGASSPWGTPRGSSTWTRTTRTTRGT